MEVMEIKGYSPELEAYPSHNLVSYPRHFFDVCVCGVLTLHQEILKVGNLS